MKRIGSVAATSAMVFALLLLLPGVLPAQEPGVARIEGILDLATGGAPRTVSGATERVLVTRAGAGEWLPAGRGMTLFRADRVLLEPRTVAWLALSAGEARGDARLAANLETADGALDLEWIGGIGRALYEIHDVPRELGDVQLTVAMGSLALHWMRGRLVLFTAGIRSVVSGTHLVLAASEDGDRAMLHLMEGEVTFPDYPGIILPAGQYALLESGAPPAVHLASEVSARMAEAAGWSGREAWPRPFYMRPAVWVGVGLGAVVVGQAVRMASNRDGGERSGTIVLEIPF
jgi:hypothetical protein